MVRWLVVGLVSVTVSATGAATQVKPGVPKSAQGPIYLVRAEPLKDDISVSVILGWDNVLVQVHKRSSNVEVIGGHLPKDAVDLAVQTWVLKSDGTALPRSWSEDVPNLGRPSSSSQDWTLIWGFRSAEPPELAAVVVRVGGTLYVRPIPQKPRNEYPAGLP
jgi:hypothetical protein